MKSSWVGEIQVFTRLLSEGAQKHCATRQAPQNRALGGIYTFLYRYRSAPFCSRVGSVKAMTADIGRDFSLARVIDPLPVRCVGAFVDVLNHVDVSIAAPCLQAVLLKQYQQDIPGRTLQNIVWKLQQYLPSLIELRFPAGRLTARHKDLQVLVPEATLVRVPARTGPCPYCPDELRARPGADRCNRGRNLPNQKAITAATGERFEVIRYKLYSWAAGVQNAIFDESRCPKCERFFLGGWSYRKNKSPQGKPTFGRLMDIRFVGAPSDENYFVIPRQQSFFAVETSFLQTMTDQLVQSGATFSSITHVWARQHREATQVARTIGLDLTLSGHTRDNLELAWFTWQATRLTMEGAKALEWSFAPSALDAILVQLQPEFRNANLRLVALHVAACPRCKALLFLIGDGKRGSCRYICGGTSGSIQYTDLMAAVYTGCRAHVGGGKYLCRVCQPQEGPQVGLIPQTRVLRSEVMEDTTGPGLVTKYVVECKNVHSNDETFEYALPRNEVRADLLKDFEIGSLPLRKDPKTKLQKPPTFKSATQKWLWYKAARASCSPRTEGGRAKNKDALTSGGPRRGKAPPRPGKRTDLALSTTKRPRDSSQRARTPGAAGTSSKNNTPNRSHVKKEGPKRRQRGRLESRGSNRKTAGEVGGAKKREVDSSWLYNAEKASVAKSSCGISKEDAEEARRRRCTRGIVTGVLQCGYLVDWQELWRGEAIEVVYLFFLRLYKDLATLKVFIQVIGYDNACQLLAFARTKRDHHAPWTQEFVDNVKMILDGFHKGNHTWCLENLPEVNPDNKENAKLMEGKNSEACEQLNSWISRHTASCLEMTPGRFAVYWWVLFREHNSDLEEQAASKRRRFAQGGMKHDPDIARQGRTGSRASGHPA